MCLFGELLIDLRTHLFIVLSFIAYIHYWSRALSIDVFIMFYVFLGLRTYLCMYVFMVLLVYIFS